MTEALRVRPHGPLEGSVRVSGATKNAGLKQMAAALLAGVTTLRNVDSVGDLDAMVAVLRGMGAQVSWSGDRELSVDTSGPLCPETPYELVALMRASINVLGPLLGRFGAARVALPVGDNISRRALDMHFRGLTAMGADLHVAHGFIEAKADKLTGAHIALEFPSNGATENLLTAAALADGTTVIENAAREPEIVELSAMLNRMGGRVLGAGTSTIEIDGVDELVPVDCELMPDRIEAGTLLMACGIAGGEITIEGARLEHLELVASKLGEMGLKVSATPAGIWARADDRLRAVDIATLPFPGFATDFMPIVVALLSVTDGVAIVTENVFEHRFGFVAELRRLGADISHEGRHAVVRGVDRLSGAPVQALDVRAGAAMVVAGLAAEGETLVLEPYHVDRGYSDLPGKLRALGADVERVAEGALA